MIGLWIALLSFDIVNTSISINSSGFDPNNLYSAWPAQIVYDLDVAFQAALLAASLEILLFAIGLLVKARRRGKEYYMVRLSHLPEGFIIEKTLGQLVLLWARRYPILYSEGLLPRFRCHFRALL